MDRSLKPIIVPDQWRAPRVDSICEVVAQMTRIFAGSQLANLPTMTFGDLA